MGLNAVLPLVWFTYRPSFPTCKVGLGITRSQNSSEYCSIQALREWLTRRGLNPRPWLLFIVTQSDLSLAVVPGPAPSPDRLLGNVSTQGRAWGRRGPAHHHPGHAAGEPGPSGSTGPSLIDCRTAHLILKTLNELACLQRIRTETPSVLDPDLPATIHRAGDSIQKDVKTIRPLAGAWEREETF